MALEGLDAIPWQRLAHAYGPATDVPDLLRALVKPDGAPVELRAKAERNKRSVFEHVVWTLWGNVFHQGTRWQASSHVVPFLAEILRDGAPGDLELRRFLVRYLHHIAIGYPADVFPTLIDPDLDFAGVAPPEDLATLVERDPQGEADYSEATMGGYSRDCYRAVEETLPLVAACARDDDQELALSAIALLASYRTELARTALRAIVEEQGGRRKSVALVALAQLDPAATRSSATPLLADHDRFVAIHAAAALLLANPREVTEATVLALTQPLDEITEESTPLTDTVGALVSRCLERLPEEHHAEAVRAIASTLSTAKTITNLVATGTLLHLVFPHGRPPKAAAELTASQRVALEAIANHGGYMLGDRTFGNYKLLLRNYHLPATAEELRAWLRA
jgi:hypothetical protein